MVRGCAWCGGRASWRCAWQGVYVRGAYVGGVCMVRGGRACI